MKSVVAGCLMLIFSVQAFYTAGVAIWFHLNKVYIASVLCENKAKPEKKCAGNCVLNKKAKKAEGNSDKTENTRTAPWVEIYPCFIEQTDWQAVYEQVDFTKFPEYPVFYSFQWKNNIFHPPVI